MKVKANGSGAYALLIGKMLDTIACADTLVQWLEEEGRDEQYIAFAIARYKEARERLAQGPKDEEQPSIQ